MIHTSTQLKALVRNKSRGDNAKAMALIRKYELLSAPKHIWEQIKSDVGLMGKWEIYQRKYDYAADYNWEDIVKNIEQLFEKLM